MKHLSRWMAVFAVLAFVASPAHAYVEAAHSFGQVVALSTNILLVRVDKVDKEKNIIIYKKVKDLKGEHKGDTINHLIGRGGFHPREWQYPMEWAEVGKTAVFFYAGNASETCIGHNWYQAYQNGDWWGMSHGEPFLLRTFAGKPEKLAQAVVDVHAGKEVVVPCMVDGNKDDLHLRKAKIQRLKVSLKLADYNSKRDFVGWGDEDFRRIASLPGFTHISGLARVDPEAQAISSVDFNADGKMDLCLVGGGKVALLQNDGEALGESSLPYSGGCRAAIWADYNGDSRPDVFLATTSGPKLFTNMGDGKWRDDTHMLPKEPGYNLTSAAWLDHDGDGKPDLLLGNGFHGLRLYRNAGKSDAKEPLTLGAWRYIGPFDNTDRKGFAAVYEPEKEIDFKKAYKGKGNKEVGWKEGKFTDGEVNSLLLFEDNFNGACYLHREIECAVDMELPVSLGSDDGVVVWLNGKKVLSQDIDRAAAPDQHIVKLPLKKGKNQFLMKVTQGGGEWAFYFKAQSTAPPAVTWTWEDVSDKVGLGEKGIGGDAKGNTLTVCDVNADGKPDFLYGAGTGVLALNKGGKFEVAKDSGISYKPGRVGPVFCDHDNDGHPDLFVPQAGGCKLFRNDGKGKFTDVSARIGDLGKDIGQATSAAWGDFDNDGKTDVVVGTLKGHNRYFRNKGDGTFEDASAAIGLDQKVCNTQAVCLVDLNGDGMLDMVFNNEGQDSCVLLGNPEFNKERQTPVALHVRGNDGVLGARIRVLDKASGKELASQLLSGGDGRGGQAPLLGRFALKPGTYVVEVRYSNGVQRAREIQVASTPLKGVIDETTPKAQ